jgi:hypothetical protein
VPKKIYENNSDFESVSLNLRPWQKELIKILEGEPDPRKIIWVYDPRGKSGKSAFVKYYSQISIYGVTVGDWLDAGDLLYLRSQRMNDKVVILDLSRAEKSTSFNSNFKESFAGAIESIKNGCVTNKKYNTETFMGPRPHVVVFSNQLPFRQYFSSDRFEGSVYRIENYNNWHKMLLKEEYAYYEEWYELMNFLHPKPTGMPLGKILNLQM